MPPSISIHRISGGFSIFRRRWISRKVPPNVLLVFRYPSPPLPFNHTLPTPCCPLPFKRRYSHQLGVLDRMILNNCSSCNWCWYRSIFGLYDFVVRNFLKHAFYFRSKKCDFYLWTSASWSIVDKDSLRFHEHHCPVSTSNTYCLKLTLPSMGGARTLNRWENGEAEGNWVATGTLCQQAI